MTVTSWPPLLELRQYTLHPSRRDDLISLFDAEFVESQEELGIRVLGQFRDLDEPDRFVWLRGFTTDDPDKRAEALAAFYGGPVWAVHGKAANATMVDSDDVFLLAPLSGAEPFAGEASHPPVGSDAPASRFDLTVCRLDQPPDSALVDLVVGEVLPLVGELAGAPVAAFRSAAVPNTFPSLPVREDEPVLAWLVRFPDATTHVAYRERLRADPSWTSGVWPRLRGAQRAEPLRLRLQPTGRSQLR